MESILILEGLHCANCAAKIEKQTKDLEGISDASLDFMAKKLKFRVANLEDLPRITDDIKAIVHKLEPDVEIQEEKPALVLSPTKKVFLLEGLDCAHCASLMEGIVAAIPHMQSATLDFLTKKLTMQTSEDVRTLFPRVEQIVKMMEPDVQVLVQDSKESTQTADKRDLETGMDRKQKIEIAKLIVGGLIFLVGFFMEFSNTVELAIFLLSYIIVGHTVVIRAFKGIIRGQVFSEHFLMSIATIGAFFVGEYPEGVAVMLFYLVGELFQDVAVNRSRRSIRALMDIRPDYANLKIGDGTQRVSPEDVRIGDIIVVKPGEKVPLDGKVLTGTSMVDTSALTGESLPRELAPGSDALSGFVNQNGVLTVEVSKSFGESTVSKILDLVQNAGSRKAPTENFISKFARYYTPAVVFGALAVAVIPPLLIQGATFSQWIYRALIFLVISCPCALVISIPLGFFGGIGGASKRGILVKGSNYLEALNNVDTVVFDKTGTLTKGVFKVTAIEPTTLLPENLLEVAALTESYSTHPIATSIAQAYGKAMDQSRGTDVQEIAGQGSSAKVDGTPVLAGNSRLMERNAIPFAVVDSVGSVVHMAIDSQYAGYLVISDEVKPDAAAAIAALRAAGVRKIAMLTGDLKQVGERIGQQLGMDEVYSELLPADKVAKLEALDLQKGKKGKLVFVGDGINDAPVLARADIGIAMGGLGSDAAIEAADIVIMTDEPSKIATAIKIAKKTRSIVMQNILFALGVKGLFLLLGASGHATMWEAVFADVGVAVIAILNAMRVMNTKDL